MMSRGVRIKMFIRMSLWVQPGLCMLLAFTLSDSPGAVFHAQYSRGVTGVGAVVSDLFVSRPDRLRSGGLFTIDKWALGFRAMQETVAIVIDTGIPSLAPYLHQRYW